VPVGRLISAVGVRDLGSGNCLDLIIRSRRVV
jgi:hypothetical protein